MNIKVQNRTIPTEAALSVLKKSYRGILGILMGMARRRVSRNDRRKNGIALRPVVANVEITRRCNLHCSMCWLWGKHGVGEQGSGELSPEEWIKVVDNVSDFVSMVYFTGGEPLTKRDLLIKLIRRIKKKRRLCSITTNGTLIDRVAAKDLVHSGLDIVTISIDGDEEEHDSVRGRGAFQKAISGIRQMVAAKRETGATMPFIKTSTTINDICASSLESLVYQLRDLEVDMCQLQYPWFLPSSLVSRHKKKMKQIFGIECQGISGYAADDMDRISPDKIESVINVFYKVMNGRFSVFPDIRALADIKKYFTDLHFNFRKDCRTPWTNVTVKADGRVNLCPDYYIPEYVVGYAQETRVQDLWNNSKARAFRVALRKHGSFPGCARCCGLFS